MTLRPAIVPVLVALAVPADAWAYLDAGTGSFLFQLAVAGLLAATMTAKLYWQRIKDFVRGRRAPPPPPPSDVPRDSSAR
jgi:hypothetical protein